MGVALWVVPSVEGGVACNFCQSFDLDGDTTCRACLSAPDGVQWTLKIAAVARFLVPHLEGVEPGIAESIMSAVRGVFIEHGGTIAGTSEPSEGFAVFLDKSTDDGAVQAAMMSCHEAGELLRDNPNNEWEGVASILEFRAGIASGTVTVDAEGIPNQDLRGLTAMIAQKLARAAGPDEVLVDEATSLQSTAEIPLHRVDPLVAGNLSLPTWRLDVRALPKRTHTGRLLSQRSLTAMIGRDHELGLVQEFFDNSHTDSRLQRVAVVGPRGSGRGRFINEVSRRIRTSWPEASTVRATIHGQDELAVPFELRRELVSSLLGFPSDTADAKARLAETLNTLSPFEPALADRFVRDRLAMIAGVTSDQDDSLTDPEHASEATYAAVAALMRAAAKRGGLVLGIHDLSNAREDHRRQLLRLLENLREHPVLVLFATSPSHTPEEDWSLDGAQDHQVDLAPLSTQSGTHLLDQLLGGPDALDQDTSAALVTHAKGLPLVLEQLLATLGDAGQLSQDHETGRWSVDSPDVLASLPHTLGELFGWRLDQISDDELLALRYAATVGPVFWRGLIADLGTPRVAAVFRRLEDRGFIRQLSGDSLAGEQAYGFTHPTLRPLLMDRCAHVDSSETHARTARWLSTRADEDDMRWTGAIAWHFANGSEPDQSASYGMAAGCWARSAGDLGLAIEHFERAHRDATNRNAQMEALLAQGEALQLARRLTEAQPLLDEAGAWADERGEPQLILRCLQAQAYADDASTNPLAIEALLDRAIPLAETLDDGQAHAKLLLGLARAQLGRGAHEDALETLATARPLAEAATDRLTLARLELQRGRLLMHMGRLAEARETLDAAADEAMLLHHDVLFELAREGKGWVALAQGEVEEGAALFTDGARVFNRLGSHRPALRCAVGLAHVEASRDHFTAAANQAAEAFELATERGEPVMVAWALSSIAWIFGEVRRGKHKLKASELNQAAIKVAKIDLGEHLQRAMAALDELGGGPGLYRGHAALALAEQLADQNDDSTANAIEVATVAVKGFEGGRLRIRLDQLVERTNA